MVKGIKDLTAVFSLVCVESASRAATWDGNLTQSTDERVCFRSELEDVQQGFCSEPADATIEASQES